MLNSLGVKIFIPLGSSFQVLPGGICSSYWAVGVALRWSFQARKGEGMFCRIRWRKSEGKLPELAVAWVLSDMEVFKI